MKKDFGICLFILGEKVKACFQHFSGDLLVFDIDLLSIHFSNKYHQIGIIFKSSLEI